MGIAFDRRPEGALILGVSPAGPAARAGIVKGDLVTHVNGIALAGMSVQEILKLITAAGETVQLTSARTGPVTVEKADPQSFAP
jgi:S1-C subfamily serine protease